MKKTIAANLIMLMAVSGFACTGAFAKNGEKCTDAECKSNKESSLPKIKTDELKASLDKVKLVDALEAKYFDRSHIPGSVSIPAGEVEKLAPTALPDKTADIVVYCMSPKCHAADNVADKLSSLGYTSVKIYRDGIKGWLSAGNTAEGTNPNEPAPVKTADAK